MSEKQKILFSDLDATLLNDRKEIEKDTRAAIDRMLARGHIFVSCTGRPFASVLNAARQSGLDQKGCYIVSYNGGAIYDPSCDQMISYASIPLPAVQRMFAEAQKAGLYIHTYDKTRNDMVLSWQDGPQLQAYIGHTKLQYQTGKDVLDKLEQPPAKMIVISLDSHERLRQFQEENAGWAEAYLNSFFSCEQYLEYCPAGISKGAAVQRLCDYLNIPVEDAVAAGDERNDISMIRSAGVGAAPRNAHPAVKECADYVCVRDHNEGAVGEIIRKFILKE